MRIASLISAGTEMLLALRLEGQVVAVSHECDWPPPGDMPRVSRANIDSSADSLAIDRQVQSLLAAGQALYQIDVDRLADLAPDLIVTQAQCDVCAVRYEDVLAAVRDRAGLAHAQVVALNPSSLGDVLRDLARLGVAAGVGERANQLVAELAARIDRVRAATALIPASQRPRTALVEWCNPIMLAGNWMPELLDLAGGRCDLTPPGEHSRYRSWDDVRHLDPQVIVVCPCGFDQLRASDDLQRLSLLPGWDSLEAVRTGRVHAVDGNVYFNRPGPRLVDSLELLAGLLHPALFKTSSKTLESSAAH